MVDPLTKPFASGRDADVYALGDGTVLRRYRAGGDVTREAELMRHVDRHGFPVPAVHAAHGPDLVLERLDGPTMLDSGLSPADMGRLLADLHVRLHRIPAPGGGPGLTVVHGDLHPENVIITAAGPVVIDWRNAEEGTAEFDIAMTAVIIAQAALDPANPAVASIAREGLTHFLAAVPDPGPGLDTALERRAADPNVTPAERSRLPEAARLIAG
jgi:aminoglycoside phosphotransferase (APT) family kinase protein